MSRMVLFDLDGTLVDSSPGIHESVRFAASELGLAEPTTAHGLPCIGAGWGPAEHGELEAAGAAAIASAPADVVVLLAGIRGDV